MKGMTKTKEYWDEKFGENMVVVCTAQILLDCLTCGFITMSRINLLIFDEAHHTKKKHPYARIMDGYYYKHEGEKPRILGMTASPVDARTRDVKDTALELERSLDSQIATISDEVLMETMHRKKQTEETVNYSRLEAPDDTKTHLWDQIFALVSRNEQFKLSLEFTKEASSVLGTWCADRYWELAMTDLETERLAARTSREFIGDIAVTRADQATEAVRRVQEIVRAHKFGAVDPKAEGLSAKVKSLHEILVHAFTMDGTKRCIVFVEKRYTARLLSDLYSQPFMRIPGMSAAYMVSSSLSQFTLPTIPGRLSIHKFELRHHVISRPSPGSPRIQARQHQLPFYNTCCRRGHRCSRLRPCHSFRSLQLRHPILAIQRTRPTSTFSIHHNDGAGQFDTYSKCETSIEGFTSPGKVLSLSFS